VFDPTYPEIDWSMFAEAIPPNAPVPRGKEVEIRMFVDSDHAGDQLVIRSRSGYFVFVNSSLVAWLSNFSG